MESVQRISDSYMCSACGACLNVCPKHIIGLQSSSSGRLSVRVENGCIGCGRCLDACPSEGDSSAFREPIVNSAVCRASDAAIYAGAQSGGACTAVLTHLLNSGKVDAVLLGSQGWGPETQVSVVTRASDLLQHQKSCYIQIPLLEGLHLLEPYGSAAVVGLPCHIQGLRKLMALNPDKYKNIRYLLGLVCDRTMCAGAVDVLQTLKPDPQEPFGLEWRSRANGPYKDAPIAFTDASGRKTIKENLYRLALKDIFTPPACRSCKDKLNGGADLVFADPWGMKEADMIGGDSLVFAHTEAGSLLLEDCFSGGELTMSRPAPPEDIIEGQHIEARLRKIQAEGAEKHVAACAAMESQPRETVIRNATRAMHRQVRYWRWRRSLPGKAVRKIGKILGCVR